MKENAKIHPSGIIFDMDGLMLDTERPAISLWNEAGKPFGYDISTETVIRTLGVNEDDTRKIFMDVHGPHFPYKAIREKFCRLVEDQLQQGIVLKKGLLFLLDHLASCKIPLAVATSTDRKGALWKLRKAGILDSFAAEACGDEIANGKPAPDIFLLAAEKLGQDPSQCIGFEDSPAGLEGLYAAGIPSVFIKDMVQPAPEILASVWRCCADLEEAANLFE